MTLSDIPISELRIGQIVQRNNGSRRLAVVVQISMEVLGHGVDRETIKRTHYVNGRYSTVCLLHEDGRMGETFKMSYTGFDVLDCVAHEWDATNFDEIKWDHYRDAPVITR